MKAWHEIHFVIKHLKEKNRMSHGLVEDHMSKGFKSQFEGQCSTHEC